MPNCLDFVLSFVLLKCSDCSSSFNLNYLSLGLTNLWWLIALLYIIHLLIDVMVINMPWSTSKSALSWFQKYPRSQSGWSFSPTAVFWKWYLWYYSVLPQAPIEIVIRLPVILLCWKGNCKRTMGKLMQGYGQKCLYYPHMLSHPVLYCHTIISSVTYNSLFWNILCNLSCYIHDWIC